MSFEGTYIYYCKNEHIFECNVYDASAICAECPICGNKIVLTRLIDDTNGTTQKQYRKILAKFKKRAKFKI